MQKENIGLIAAKREMLGMAARHVELDIWLFRKSLRAETSVHPNRASELLIQDARDAWRLALELQALEAEG